MSRQAESAFVALLAGLAWASLALAGCAADGTGVGLASAPTAPDWVASPAAPLTVQVTGSAVIECRIAAAEQAARADALAAIGAFLDGAQAQVGAAGSQPAAVGTAVQSARVRGKFHDGRHDFVWMACDAVPDDAPSAARHELARLVARRNRG